MTDRMDQFIANLQKGLMPGVVTADEVIEVVQTMFKVIKDLEENLNSSITAGDDKTTAQSQEIRDDLDGLTVQVTSLTRTNADLVGALGTKVSSNFQDTQRRMGEMFRELQRISDRIPSMPNMEPVQKRITELERKMSSLPGEDTAEKIRNRLETLKGDERLDAFAIKNLPKAVQSTSMSIGGGSSGIKGVSAGTNISVDGNPYTPMVTLNIPVQSTAPADPVVNQLWIDST